MQNYGNNQEGFLPPYKDIKNKNNQWIEKSKKKFVGYCVQGATKTVRNRRLVAFRQRRKYTYI